MIQKILFSVIILFLNLSSFSQSSHEDSGDYHNDIHIEITPNPFWGFANINYERKIIQLNKNRISAETGFGYWQTWGAGGTTFKFKANDTFGKKKHHLEAGLGVMALYDRTNYKIGVSNANYFSEPVPTKIDYTNFHLAVSIGYLYKKPQGNFIFKTGLAWPESFYLGFGYGF